MDVVAHCGECGLEFGFGVTADPTDSLDDILERVRAKLGDDGSYVCPRCKSLVFVQGDQTSIALAKPERLNRAAAAHRISKSARGVRFVVGSPVGARSGIWRVWTNNRRDDLYIAARNLGRTQKVSLHPGFWYYGFTQDYVQRGAPLLPEGRDRKLEVWEKPAEFAEGWLRAFSVIIPASEVDETPEPYEGKEVVWYPKPPDGEAAHFTILISKPDAPRGRRGFPSAEGYAGKTELVTRLELSTGETAWVVTHNAPIDNATKQHLDDARERMKRDASEVIAKEAQKKETFAPRAALYGNDDQGARFFYDLSLAALLPDAA